MFVIFPPEFLYFVIGDISSCKRGLLHTYLRIEYALLVSYGYIELISFDIRDSNFKFPTNTASDQTTRNI